MAESSTKSQQFDIGSQKLAGVYAKALLDAAQSTGETAAVMDELNSLVADVLAANPRLETILGSRLIAPEEKHAMLDRLFGKSASKLFLNFLKILADKERLDILRAIQQEARSLHDAMRGLIEVEVITAGPLDEQLASQMNEQLRRLTGGTPRLVARQDPDLIGGVVLRVGDTIYDGSLATQLKRIRTEMIDRSVHEIQSRRDRFRDSGGN